MTYSSSESCPLQEADDPLLPADDPLLPADDPLLPADDPLLPAGDSVLPADVSLLPVGDALATDDAWLVPSSRLAGAFFIKTEMPFCQLGVGCGLYALPPLLLKLNTISAYRLLHAFSY